MSEEGVRRDFFRVKKKKRLVVSRKTSFVGYRHDDFKMAKKKRTVRRAGRKSRRKGLREGWKVEKEENT